MRHGLTGRQLSRNTPHRWAMLRNMAASLLRHETIRTTVPKAKELRRYVEPLITLGKTDSLANRPGDAAPMALMALVDRAATEEAPAAEEPAKKPRARRKKAAEPVTETATEEAAAEEAPAKKPRPRKKKAAAG